MLKILSIRKKYKPNITMHGEKVLGNSSFKPIKRQPGKIYTSSSKRLLPKKYLHKEYYEITKLITKYNING